MSQPSPVKPYVGLIPFREEDAAFFFGREQEREIIISNLMASRLTLLYGESGVGKSSVLRAGVAHRLREQARRNLKRGGKPKFAIVVFSSWRDEPLSGLLKQVSKAVETALGHRDFEPVAADLSFVESLREWARRVQGQLFIVLDQFEEYFLYHPNQSGAGTFAEEFPLAVNTAGLPVNFIVSYREDAHAKLDFFRKSIPNVYDNCLRIGHLDHDAACAAILKPVEQYNTILKLDEEQGFSVEPGLVKEVLEQVRVGEKFIGESGKGVVGGVNDEKGLVVETPYLQLVMERLWDETVEEKSRVLRLSTLTRLGGAKSIVQTHLDNAMKELTPRQRQMGASIFNHLVTPSGTKIAQTVPDLADYSKLSHEKEAQLADMMEKLARGERRILRTVAPPPTQPDSPRYEVFHDVLAQAILDWRRRYLARRERRRLLLGAGIALALVLFMTAVTAYALQQRTRAEKEASAAEAARAGTELQRIAAVQNAEEARKQQALAQQNAARAEENAHLAEEAAAKNEKLAASNEQLADKFKAAYQSENRAKAVAERATQETEAVLVQVKEQKALAVAAALKAKEEEGKAVEAARRATEQQERAERALHTIDRIDRSNAYYKAVIRSDALFAATAAAINADGTKVLTRLQYGEELLWNVNNINRLPTGELPSAGKIVGDVSFSPTDRTLAVSTNYEEGGRAGIATIWDVSGEQPVKLDSLSLDIKTGLLSGAGFSADSNSFAVFSMEAVKMCKWNAGERKLGTDCVTSKYPSLEAYSRYEAFSPDGSLLVYSINKNSEFYAYDVNVGTPVKLEVPNLGALSQQSTVAISPDKKYVATYKVDNVARVFDARTGKLIAQFSDGKGLITKVTFSPDSKLLVTASTELSASVWEISTGKKVATHTGHAGSISDAEFSPDGKYVVTASADKTARVWAVSDGRLVAELRGHIDELRSAAFSSNGDFVLTDGGGEDSTTRVWDLSGLRARSNSAATATIPNGSALDLIRVMS